MPPEPLLLQPPFRESNSETEHYQMKADSLEVEDNQSKEEVIDPNQKLVSSNTSDPVETSKEKERVVTISNYDRYYDAR